MTFLDFITSLGDAFNSDDSNNGTQSTVCVSKINEYMFYQLALIPAAVLTLLMASTKARRQKLLSVLNGRPSLVFPMDTMTRSSKISYCCAFGATVFLLCDIIFEGKFAIEYDGLLALKTLIAILSMFIYGIVLFPIFTCLALATAFSYGLGTLYIWMFFAVEIYKLTECVLDATEVAIGVGQSVPSLLCYAYLSISLPVRFVRSIYKKRYIVPSHGEDAYIETIEQIKKSYQGLYVRKLLQKPEIVKPPVGIVNIVKAAIMRIFGKLIYHRESGFRYPSRLMSVLFVAACILYAITFSFLVSFESLWDSLRQKLEYILSQVGEEFQPDEGLEVYFIRLTTLILLDLLVALRASIIVSLCVSCAIGFLNILHMLTSFRTNLQSLYRGDYTHIPPADTASPISLCVGSIKFAGFQVAYIAWAYVIIALILFIFCFVISCLVIFLFGLVRDWTLNKLMQLWPGLLIAIALFWIQFILAKFLFLQDRGQYLRLDNRRFYFIFTYFMFFFNIFMGIVSCVMRILKAMLVGILFLSRLDNSTMPRKFEFFDPGFKAYVGYIHMEAAHTHPVVNVFIRLLFSMSKSKQLRNTQKKRTEATNQDVILQIDHCSENGIESSKRRPTNFGAWFNWQVTYTLLHNPMVRIYRKGFIQAMKKARKEGLKIPISDMPITDFDLVKAQEEKSLEEKEESLNQTSDVAGGLSLMASGMGFHKKSSKGKKQKEKRSKGNMWTKMFRKWKNRNALLSQATTMENEMADWKV